MRTHFRSTLSRSFSSQEHLEIFKTIYGDIPADLFRKLLIQDYNLLKYFSANSPPFCNSKSVVTDTEICIYIYIRWQRPSLGE